MNAPLEVCDNLAFAAEGALRHIVDPDAKHRLMRALLAYAGAAELELGGSPVHMFRSMNNVNDSDVVTQRVLIGMAADVCAALDIKDSSSACERLDQDEQETIRVQSGSRMIYATFVTEPGLYSEVRIGTTLAAGADALLTHIDEQDPQAMCVEDWPQAPETELPAETIARCAIDWPQAPITERSSHHA